MTRKWGRSAPRVDKRKLRDWYLEDYCESCGFYAVDRCQLDLDHFDGNSLNHDPDNLWTLCANCHRLKTKDFKDAGKPSFYVPVEHPMARRGNNRLSRLLSFSRDFTKVLANP